MSSEQKKTRRELLKMVGRYGVLVGLVGGVGALVGRRGCAQTTCAGCGKLARCDLEAAVAARVSGVRAEGRS